MANMKEAKMVHLYLWYKLYLVNIFSSFYAHFPILPENTAFTIKFLCFKEKTNTKKFPLTIPIEISVNQSCKIKL